MSNFRLASIAVMAANRAIGTDNKLPWYLPEDLARFKRLTMGGVLIVGRKTFDSIGRRALPGRRLVVVSRQAPPGETPERVEFAPSVDAALALALALAAGDGSGTPVWIAGGAEIYRQTMDRVDRLYLTRIDADFPGDAFFPAVDPAVWRLVEEERRAATAAFPHPYRFETWERATKLPPVA